MRITLFHGTLPLSFPPESIMKPMPQSFKRFRARKSPPNRRRAFAAYRLRTDQAVLADRRPVRYSVRRLTSLSWRPVTALGAPVIGSDALLVFGEGDDVADGCLAPSSMTRRSRPSAMPPWGGAAQLERVDEVAELLLNLLIAQAARAQHGTLLVGVVDTDGAAAHLKAVHHEVVAVAAARQRVALDLVHVLVEHVRERMVLGGVLSSRPRRT